MCQSLKVRFYDPEGRQSRVRYAKQMSQNYTWAGEKDTRQSSYLHFYGGGQLEDSMPIFKEQINELLGSLQLK